VSARFITFEGIDGAGKSSHIEALATCLRDKGRDVVCTREPGGTPLAERLRELMLHEPMDALTEALVVFAARRDHLHQVILPALASGRTVLCDRFTDATFAYQGGGRGFDTGVLQVLEGWVQQGVQPDLTFWFDLPAETAAARRGAARAPDRFEQQDVDFFNRVRSGYQRRMNVQPGRFARLDASRPIDEVRAQWMAEMERRGW
jgi:dTMP kinase